MLSLRIYALNRAVCASRKFCTDHHKSAGILGKKIFVSADVTRPCSSQSGEGGQNDLSLNQLNNQSEVVMEGVDFSIHGPSPEGVQGGHDFVLDTVMDVQSGSEPVSKETSTDAVTAEQVDTYNCHENVNLYSCMQTNVPDPCKTDFNHAEHYNMPGSGSRLFDKYIQDVSTEHHQSKKFHTSSEYSQSVSAQQYAHGYAQYGPSPQGIQGDDCVNLELWKENCYRYNLPNCDEQLNSIVTGKKTLAQVFREQEELIKEIAQAYRSSQQKKVNKKHDAQIDNEWLNTFTTTSPQGIQGDKCVQFKLWLENCNRFGINEKCLEQLDDVKSNRRTLAQIFAEQDKLIRDIVKQTRRGYSTSTQERPEVGSKTKESYTSEGESDQPITNQSSKDLTLSQRDRLKRAVKEYGSTVIVFHIGISLVSLGGFYLAVSSGIDVVSLLTHLGVSESVIQSKLTTGASVFVMAYAIHKVFAPVRIGITLMCTPLIVQYLRRIGFLKAPVPKQLK